MSLAPHQRILNSSSLSGLWWRCMSVYSSLRCWGRVCVHEYKALQLCASCPAWVGMPCEAWVVQVKNWTWLVTPDPLDGYKSQDSVCQHIQAHVSPWSGSRVECGLLMTPLLASSWPCRWLAVPTLRQKMSTTQCLVCSVSWTQGQARHLSFKASDMASLSHSFSIATPDHPWWVEIFLEPILLPVPILPTVICNSFRMGGTLQDSVSRSILSTLWRGQWYLLLGHCVLLLFSVAALNPFCYALLFWWSHAPWRPFPMLFVWKALSFAKVKQCGVAETVPVICLRYGWPGSSRMQSSLRT